MEQDIWFESLNFSVCRISLPRTGSDIIRLKVLGHTIVILNSFKAATDLVDQRSAIYSDRSVMSDSCAS